MSVCVSSRILVDDITALMRFDTKVVVTETSTLHENSGRIRFPCLQEKISKKCVCAILSPASVNDHLLVVFLGSSLVE